MSDMSLVEYRLMLIGVGIVMLLVIPVNAMVDWFTTRKKARKDRRKHEREGAVRCGDK